MTKLARVASILSTLQVDDDPVVLDCTPDFAESVWFSNVHYRDQRNFELVTEWFGNASCKVFIRRWEDSPDYTVNDRVGPFAFLALILTILGILWLML